MQGEWLRDLSGLRLKSMPVEMSDVEYWFLKKRAKRCGIEFRPGDMVRQLIVKAILYEESVGLCEITKHKNGWKVTLKEPVKAEPVESTFVQETQESQSADVESEQA